MERRILSGEEAMKDMENDIQNIRNHIEEIKNKIGDRCPTKEEEATLAELGTILVSLVGGK